MSGFYTPERQVDIHRNGNLYTIHLLDLELAPSTHTVKAIAHLAIAASNKVSDVKSELSNEMFLVEYAQQLRNKQRENSELAISFQTLTFLDHNQMPPVNNKLRYFSALIVADQFELKNDEIVYPEPEATPYDFVLSIFDLKRHGGDDKNKYLGI